jgi:hypothetical protein
MSDKASEPSILKQPAETAADRSFRAIANIERQKRAEAERCNEEYQKLLIDVANHNAGADLEAVQKADPTAFAAWKPEDWRNFFTAHVFLQPGSVWGESKSKGTNKPAKGSFSRQRLEALHKQLAKLQSELALAMKEFDKLDKPRDQQADEPEEAAEERPEPLVEGEPLLNDIARRQAVVPAPPAIPSGPAAGIERLIPQPVNDAPRGHEGIIDELRRWQPPLIPVRFKQLAKTTEERWYRQSMALYVLARYGVSCRMELDALLSMADEAKKRTSAIRKAVDQLPELGLVRRDILDVTAKEGLSSRLVIMDFTDQGRELCRIFGWQIEESDWGRASRIFRGSTTHLMGVFFLAAHARLRGYKALVFPPPFSPAGADLLLKRGEERSLVYVEFSEQDSGRWLLGDSPVSPPAYFTLNKQARAGLVDRIKAGSQTNPRLAHGAATDMETLIGVQRIAANSPLWAESW